MHNETLQIGLTYVVVQSPKAKQ